MSAPKSMTELYERAFGMVNDTRDDSERKHLLMIEVDSSDFDEESGQLHLEVLSLNMSRSQIKKTLVTTLSNMIDEE